MNRKSFTDSIRALVAIAWPDVVDNGIFMMAEVLTIPLEALSQTDRIPFALIDDQMAPVTNWGMTNQCASGPVTLYRVVKNTEDWETDILADLLTMQTTVLANTFDYGCMVGHPEVSIDHRVMPNDYFLRVNAPLRAGAVTFQCLAGEAK